MPNVWTHLQNFTAIAYKKKRLAFKKSKQSDFNLINQKYIVSDDKSKQHLRSLRITKRLRFSVQFGSFKNSLYYRSPLEKLNELKKYADKVLTRKESYNEIRTEHDKNKQNFFNKWKHCFICKKMNVQHIHHIIQVNHGGSNDEGNLIGLCKNCHSDIHSWMK